MGRAVRTTLSRISPLPWGGVITIAILQAVGIDGLGGLLVLCAALGVAGTTCGAIEATHDHCIDTLLLALVDSGRPTPAPRRAHLRRVAA